MRKVYIGDTQINDTYIGKHKVDVTEIKATPMDYVLVAGGGGGGAGGAGGGAGEVETNFFGGSRLVFIPGVTYNVVVGSGGLGGDSVTGSLTTIYNQGTGSNGEDSYIISSIEAQATMSIALGGGGGAGYYKTNPTLDAQRSGSEGGSGGGSGILAGLASGSASGSNSYGNNGGVGQTSGSYTAPHGGGGGASTVGEDGEFYPWDLLDTKVTGLTAGATFFYRTTYFGDEIEKTVGTGFFQTDMVSGSIRPSGSFTEDDFTIQTFGTTSSNVAVKNGNGGEPLVVDWLSNFYNNGEVGAGGGAGANGQFGGYDVENGTGGGNTGGNGQDISGTPTATSGSQFSGAGGGGGFIEGTFPYNVGDGADGGSGIALIRYEGTEAKWSGGEVTISGSYVYHLFTGSADFTFIES